MRLFPEQLLLDVDNHLLGRGASVVYYCLPDGYDSHYDNDNAQH